jgi:hypothetical protein
MAYPEADLAFHTVATLEWYGNPKLDFEKLLAEHEQRGLARAIRRVQKSPYVFPTALQRNWGSKAEGDNPRRAYIFSKSRNALGSPDERGHLMSLFELIEMQSRDQRTFNSRQKFEAVFQTMFAEFERTIQ